jgi:hypothetical protein
MTLIPKYPPFVSQKMRDGANGRDCTMEVILDDGTYVCNYDPSTTIGAHLSPPQGSGGTGGKVDDFCIAWICASCHEWYDQYKGTEYDRLYFRAKALHKTHQIAFGEGILGQLRKT